MTTPSTLQASLLGRCPKCGQGALFDGYLSIAPAIMMMKIAGPSPLSMKA